MGTGGAASHPRQAEIYDQLSLFQFLQGKLPEAEVNARRSLAIIQNHFDMEDPAVAMCELRLGTILFSKLFLPGTPLLPRLPRPSTPFPPPPPPPFPLHCDTSKKTPCTGSAHRQAWVNHELLLWCSRHWVCLSFLLLGI